jgi:predicted RNA-binding Zn-ribbon protein involved in translation (DUF1610 family)
MNEHMLELRDPADWECPVCGDELMQPIEDVAIHGKSVALRKCYSCGALVAVVEGEEKAQ